MIPKVDTRLDLVPLALPNPKAISERATFYVKHIQRLVFDVPVFCEPLVVRLRPQNDRRGNVRSTRLDVTPDPASIQEMTDLFGNRVWRVRFTELMLSVKCVVTSCVERNTTVATSVCDESALHQMYHRVREARRPYADWASETFRQYPDSPYEFARQLTARIAEQARGEASSQRRYTMAGDQRDGIWASWHWAECLADAARGMNMPARLVRGYNAKHADEIEEAMRIWTELRVPGVGWCGFDPWQGDAVDYHYIPVAFAPSIGSTQMINGRYRGTSRHPTSSTQIIIRQAAERRPHEIQQ